MNNHLYFNNKNISTLVYTVNFLSLDYAIYDVVNRQQNGKQYCQQLFFNDKRGGFEG